MMTALVLVLALQAGPLGLTEEEEVGFILHFKQNIPPEVTMDLEDAAAVNYELNLQQADIPTYKAQGVPFVQWLVARGICADTPEVCRFTVRYGGYYGKNHQTKNSEYFVRYVVRSASGVQAEGFAYARSPEPKDHSYWLQKNGFWTIVFDKTEREREYTFVATLIQILETAKKLVPAPKGLPPGSLSHFGAHANDTCFILDCMPGSAMMFPWNASPNEVPAVRSWRKAKNGHRIFR